MSADRFKFKRGSTASVNAYLPQLGEPVFDTTLNQLRVGDGVTLGGVNLAEASTALKLATARAISLSGQASGTTSFDGSSDVTIEVTLGNSLALTGVPTAATAVADTNSTQLATTAFVIGQASSALPIVDGTAAIGTSAKYARQDHVHPIDTSRAPLASPTFTGLVSLNGGQLAFPATQLPSADPNTLDDYEEGIWTPTLTFATPGDLSVTYGTRVGFYTKIGREVTLRFNIITSAFTHTTASGSLQITGVPFSNSATASSGSRGVLDWGGINKASYTSVVSSIGSGGTLLTFQANGMGQAATLVTSADVPTGGTVTLTGTIVYMT